MSTKSNSSRNSENGEEIVKDKSNENDAPEAPLSPKLNKLKLDENAPKPRLCHLKKWPHFQGYGFNLHAERSKMGQHIGKVDADSPADSAGLREGDRIIEVNYVNISNENHQQVVKRIRNGLDVEGKIHEDEVVLLVVDHEADEYYKKLNIIVRHDMDNVSRLMTPPKVDKPEEEVEHEVNNHTEVNVIRNNSPKPNETDSNNNISSNRNSNLNLNNSNSSSLLSPNETHNTSSSHINNQHSRTNSNSSKTSSNINEPATDSNNNINVNKNNATAKNLPVYPVERKDNSPTSSASTSASNSKVNLSCFFLCV